VMLLDVTPLSLGLETIGGVMKPLVPRNTSVPVRRSEIFSTSENSQTTVEVHVLQGERPMAADNKSLGRFKLMGIPPAPRGIPQVQVSFDIDSNGILQVSALDKTTGREQTVTIQGASTLSDTEITRMIQESEDYAQQDRQKKAKVDRRNRAESLASQCDRKLREVQLDYGMYFAEQPRRQVEGLIREVRDCLKADDERGLDLTVSDLQDALDRLSGRLPCGRRRMTTMRISSSRSRKPLRRCGIRSSATMSRTIAMMRGAMGAGCWAQTLAEIPGAMPMVGMPIVAIRGAIRGVMPTEELGLVIRDAMPMDPVGILGRAIDRSDRGLVVVPMTGTMRTIGSRARTD
jgi:hypothetical protein